jgi:hypothetical protein
MDTSSRILSAVPIAWPKIHRQGLAGVLRVRVAKWSEDKHNRARQA